MANATAKASAQQHLDIEDITENLVLLKSGNVAMVLSSTAVNFDILSEAEQDATIYAYAAFLNSLSFPLQILIRSKKADITSYYQHLEESMQNQQNPDLKRQIQKYMEFVQSTVQKKTILDKQFYLIITFSPLEIGLRGLKKPQAAKSKGKTETIKDAKINLFPKRDHIVKQAARLGLIAGQLTTKELVELFYDIYNPAPTGTQRIILDAASYTAPLVKPAVESPEPAPPSVTGQASTQAQVQQPQPPYPQPIPQQAGDVNQQQALQNLKLATANAAKFIGKRQQSFNQNLQVANQNARQTAVKGQPNTNVNQ